MAMVVCLIFCMASCNRVDPDKKSEGVMTHAEFMAAEVDSEIVIEGFVQAKQSWWNNKGTFYLQDGTGGYYVYELPCTESEYNSLTVGTKVQVKGSRAKWGNLDEVMNVTEWKIIEGDTYVAEATDITDKLGNKSELVKCTSMFVSIKDLTFVTANYKNGGGDDIYVVFAKGEVGYSFTVEVYLTGTDSDVYKAVADLEAGDVVDVEGFLMWYEDSIDMHITGIN